MKVTALRTKTLTANTPGGLDGAIVGFLKTLGEEQYIETRFATRTMSDGTPEYAAILFYTG